MANLIALATTVPNGVWEKILFAFNGAFKNYALAVIILTVIIKLITLPLDFLNRRSTLKMNEVQGKLKPKIAEIKNKYQDSALQNQKINELYQKEGFNPMGSCLTMLLVMVMSIGVFFTLFASLNNMAAYKIVNQYDNLKVAYVREYVKEERGLDNDGFYALELNDAQIREYVIQISTTGTDEQKQTAVISVNEKYKEVKEKFLWIKNVWLPDSPSSKAIADFDTYYNLGKLKELNLTEEELGAYKTEYIAVMGGLEESEGVNGYFILAVLAGVTAFLYQYFLNKKKEKQKTTQDMHKNPNEAQTPEPSGKAMMFILPIIMLVFTLRYNSIFALYIITSQTVGMATSPLINKFINKSTKK